MKYKIRELSWYKRREPTKEAKPVSVEVEDLQLVDNHMCKMRATYDDGNIYDLTARVCLNDIKGIWTVHGIDHQGHSVLCDIIE